MEKRKGYLLVIAALLFCLFLCIPAAAESATEDFYYYVDDEGAHVTAYNGTDVHVIIPDTLGGEPVVSVSLDGSADRLSVARITLPDSVVRLDDYAFNGYQNVQQIDGLENIQYIGQSAFAFCSMQTLEFSDQLIHIGSRVFEAGTLTHLTIPDDVTYDDAAISCWTLEQIKLTDGSGPQTLALKDGVLFSADLTHLVAYPIRNPRSSYTIPDGVKTVEWAAFDRAGHPLCELFIPASVERFIPANYNISGRLIMYVYEGTAGHEMAAFLASMYDTDRFEYVLLDAQENVETMGDYVAGIIAETTNSSMSDYQKALALHDWLTEHAEYDFTYTHTTAYDLLKNGLGICCSYADAYVWLLSEVGIPCKVVGNYNHALVAACLDGSWTYIDPTHNDGNSQRPYFGMNDAMFKYRYGSIYPEHYNNMIVVTEKLDTGSVKSHYWYRNGWHEEAYAYLTSEIEERIAQGENGFVVAAADYGDYVEPFVVMLCAGLVTEDGIDVDGQLYEVTCTMNEAGDWYVYLGKDQELANKNFRFEIQNGGIRITKYVGSDTKVVIPDSIAGLPVTCIGDAAFRMNYLLEEVVLPEGLIEIEGNAFYNCMSLKTINIPSALRSIGQEAFDSCYRLESDIVLPENFVRLSAQAFERCKRITRVYIPGNASVEDCAFMECDMLCDVTIGEGFMYLSGSVFSQCFALTSITLPESLVYIGPNAFYRTGITSIHIPRNVSMIGTAPFQECHALETVTLDADNPNFKMDSGVIYSADGKVLVLATPACEKEDFVVPDSVECIQYRAFHDNDKLKSVYIPSNVKRIEDEAFCDCDNLAYIFMEDGCTSLGFCCFGMDGGQAGETKVRLAATISEMSSHVLINRPLTSLVLPFDAQTVTERLLDTPNTIYTHRNVTHCSIIPNASTLTVYGYPGSVVEEWSAQNGSVFIPYTVSELPAIVIKPGESIALEGLPEHYAMRWYSEDETVAAVSDDGAVTAVSLGRTVIEGEVETKSNTIEVFRCEIVVDSQERLVLPEGLTVLEEEAFMGCAAAEIEIPAGVTAIPSRAFANCTELICVYIPATVTSIAEDAFSGCQGSVTIVTSEGSEAHRFAVSHGFGLVLR